MAVYFLDYDLRKQRDYKTLYNELAKFKAVRVLKSQWCFNCDNTSAAKMCDHFAQFMDADDGICVIKEADWAAYRAIGTPRDLK